MLSSSLFLEIHPFVTFWGEAGRQAQAPAPCPVPAETASPCPYMRRQVQQCEPTHVVNPETLRSVMDNLRALEQASEQMQQARKLAERGCYLEALECLEKVRELCPGSSFDKQVEEASQEFISAIDAQMDETTEPAAEEEPEGCGCCCFCCWLNQFGMCSFSQFIDWCMEQSKKAAEPDPYQGILEELHDSAPEGCDCCCNWFDLVLCWIDPAFSSLTGGMHLIQVYETDPNRRILELLQNSEDLRQIQNEWEQIWLHDNPPSPAPEHIHGGISPECDKPAKKGCCGGSHCSPLKALLYTPVSMSFRGEPLSKVLDEITFTYGVPFVIDRDALEAQGYLPLDEIPIHLHVEQLALKSTLQVLLGRCHLQAEVRGCVIAVTPACGKRNSECEKGSAEPCEEVVCPKMCGSVCPKCEAMHAKHAKQAGVKEQVDGLMKACYLALGDGRFEKAADLAHQAHALDPDRVEGDPLIWKLHLLAEPSIQPAPTKDACPKSHCPRSCPIKEYAPACDVPGLRPDLPDVSSDLPAALDEVLTDKDELSKKADDEDAKKRCFSLGLDMECCGISLEQVGLLLQGCFLPPPLTERSMHLTLGTSGIGVQGTVPCNGVNYTVYFRDGVFLMWMTPEKTAK
jgi:hypothetical protein